MAKPFPRSWWDLEQVAVINCGAFMSESRSNHASQAGMAMLAIVVLFGALFLGIGGVFWMRASAQRTALEEAIQMERQAEVQRQRAEAAQAALDAAQERADDSAPAEAP